MKFILLIMICGSFLFSVIINNKYFISKSALSSLSNADNIYKYIKEHPRLLTKIKNKGFFSFFGFNSKIKTKKYSSYKSIYEFKTINSDYIYIKIPIKLLRSELDLKEYKAIQNNSPYYVLRFKKEFTKEHLVYLSLNIGEKKEFTFTFKSEDVYEFLKKHSNLLFAKEDLLDMVSVSNEKIVFTTNYTKKDFKLNFYLKDFIGINRGKIISKNIEKKFLLKISDKLPSLECDNKSLLDSISIDDEEFILEEEKITNHIYSLFLLSNEEKFNEFLKDSINFISLSSEITSPSVHSLSYEYKTKEIKMLLKLPKNIDYEIKSKFISSFNSFKIKINEMTFEGYVDGKRTYSIPKDICREESNVINVLNTKNYLEYTKWSMNIDNNKHSITWTPNFNIHKISPIIYAPFLLKKQNKYVVNSMIDEESKMKGEVIYAYIDNNTIYQNKAIINPQTNTNLYFKYPKNANINDILKKTKFTYNANPISIASSIEGSMANEIKFTSSLANKIALIYIPSGNIDSFRKYFLRYFECNQEEAKDNETCFNYLADMENGINVFLNNLRKNKKYSQLVYRKSIFKEKDKKNLFILNRENRNYIQASDEEVLGKNYDKYKWDLSSSLAFDKKIFQNYGLNNIDLIYFSNINDRDTSTLATLNNYGFNKVFLINFGKNIGNAINKYENLNPISHKYNKTMESKIQELDTSIFDTILKQITKK